MKLIKKLLSDLENKDVRILANQYEDVASVVKLWNTCSISCVDVEVVYDNDMTLYDYRVFDPYNHIEGLYTGFDGWTGWLCDYRDLQGNDIDTIFMAEQE